MSLLCRGPHSLWRAAAGWQLDQLYKKSQPRNGIKIGESAVTVKPKAESGLYDPYSGVPEALKLGTQTIGIMRFDEQGGFSIELGEG